MSNFRAPLRTIQTDFRAGEIDPKMAMRSDLPIYPSGAKSLQNMLVHNVGPASRRPGTLMLNQLNNRARLLPFEFDTNEKYALAFTNARLDIYSPAGTLLQTFTGQPWGISQLWEITFIQKGNVMILTHLSFRMRRLERTGLNTFVMTALDFSSDTGTNVKNQPYTKYLGNNDKMAVSNVDVGTGRTLTSSASIFSAAWIGERVRIYNREMTITAVVSPTSATVTVNQRIEDRLGLHPFRFTKGSARVEVTHPLHGLDTGAGVLIQGATGFGALNPGNIEGNYGVTVVDEDHYAYNMIAVVADLSGDGGGAGVDVSTTNLTRNWTEQVWSDRRGWPGACCLHENRVWLGGSLALPTFLAASAVGAYYDFAIRDGLDDESIQGTISATARILHLVSAKQLQIFTEDGEYISETAQGDPVTPGSFKVVNASAFGSSWTTRPQVFDGATLFVQRSGKNVREILYDYTTDQAMAAPVSVLASHLVGAPFDMALLFGTPTRPEQYAFLINSAGSLVGTVACFISLRSEKLAAWTQLVPGTGGFFDSVCVIGNSVYFSVLRHGGYALERLELDATDIWLDGAVKKSGAASASWDLGTFFGNVTVDVMSNGNYIGRFTTDAASVVTLPFPVTNLVAGYAYETEIIPMPPVKEMTDGPMTGEIRRIVSSTLHYHNSVSASVNGRELLYDPEQNVATQPPLRSGKYKIRLLGYDRDPTIVINQPQPGPLTLLGMTMEVSI